MQAGGTTFRSVAGRCRLAPRLGTTTARIGTAAARHRNYMTAVVIGPGPVSVGALGTTTATAEPCATRIDRACPVASTDAEVRPNVHPARDCAPCPKMAEQAIKHGTSPSCSQFTPYRSADTRTCQLLRLKKCRCSRFTPMCGGTLWNFRLPRPSIRTACGLHSAWYNVYVCLCLSITCIYTQIYEYTYVPNLDVTDRELTYIHIHACC